MAANCWLVICSPTSGGSQTLESKIAIPVTCIGIIFFMKSLSLPSFSSLWFSISSSRLAVWRLSWLLLKEGEMAVNCWLPIHLLVTTAIPSLKDHKSTNLYRYHLPYEVTELAAISNYFLAFFLSVIFFLQIVWRQSWLWVMKGERDVHCWWAKKSLTEQVIYKF